MREVNTLCLFGNALNSIMQHTSHIQYPRSVRNKAAAESRDNAMDVSVSNSNLLLFL